MRNPKSRESRKSCESREKNQTPESREGLKSRKSRGYFLLKSQSSGNSAYFASMAATSASVI